MDYFVLKSVCMPSDWMRAICCSVPTEKALGMVTANDVSCRLERGKRTLSRAA